MRERTEIKQSASSKIVYSLRIIVPVLMVVAIAAFVYKFMPQLLILLETGDMEAMEAYVEAAGGSGIWIIVLLQTLQTITIFFPGIPIYMCAGLVYGHALGVLICYLTYVISNTVIFLLHRYLKESADALMDNPKNSKIMKLFKNSKRPDILTAVLCVVPVVPNGIIPHIAASSRITTKDFLKAVAIGCLPCIILFVWCGDLLTSVYFAHIMVVITILAIGGAVFGMIFNKQVSDVAFRFIERISANESKESEEATTGMEEENY